MVRKQSKQRKPKLRTPFCKPCWELKYCPYGPFVENFPLSPDTLSLRTVKKRYRDILKLLAAGTFKSEKDIQSAIDSLEFFWPPRWEFVKQYDVESLACNLFGHICPVFLTAETWATETRQSRLHSRHIPRGIMLKVVRRDGQICQQCLAHVPDDELEFDHVIPHSRGGPTTVENLRVLCRGCNSKKHDSLPEILEEPKGRGAA